MINAKTASVFNNLLFLSLTIVLVACAIVPLFYKEELISVGRFLLGRYGQNNLDLALLLITVISSSPIGLPIWVYPVYGFMMGFNPVRLILVVSIGSTAGSFITYFIGKYFQESSFVKNKFLDIRDNQLLSENKFWTKSLILFGITAAPFPSDIIYAACGFRNYPAIPFGIILFIGRIVRYTLLIAAWNYFNISI